MKFVIAAAFALALIAGISNCSENWNKAKVLDSPIAQRTFTVKPLLLAGLKVIGAGSTAGATTILLHHQYEVGIHLCASLITVPMLAFATYWLTRSAYRSFKEAQNIPSLS